MIANALRVEIELFSKSRCRRNALFVMAEAGQVSRSCVRGYLQNIHYLISHTPPCLKRAAAHAREEGDETLASHFEHKLAEEAGHEVWAERDLDSVRESSTVLVSDVTEGMRDLVEYILSTIDRNPTLYLSYILFAEYFTVLVGPEWIKMLEERCGIPRTSLSVIANHVELDVDHVENALDEIDDLVGDPAMLPDMRDVLLESMARFESFCTELAARHEKDHERDQSAFRPAISAA